MSNPLLNEEIFWAPMARCDRCGQFMKRGLMNWAAHLDVCKGKKPIIESTIEPGIRVVYVGPEIYDTIMKAQDEYFEEMQKLSGIPSKVLGKP